MAASQNSIPTIHVAIQGWFLPQAHTGIGVHTSELLKALARNPELELTVFAPKPNSVPESSPVPDGVTLHVVKPWGFIPHAGLQKALWEMVQFPWALRRWKKAHQNVIYAPYPSPLFAALLPSKTLCVMTAHDTILWDDPRYRAGLFKKAYHALCRSAFHRADRRCTVSESVKATLLSPPYNDGPIHVLYNGRPSAAAMNPNAELHAESKSKTLLYVGGYDVRKQVPKLLEAFAEAHAKNPDLHLQLVGRIPQPLSTLVTSKFKNLPIQILGPLSVDELKQAYQNAWAFVHTSDSEGFNLPLLEAMTLGVPAVVSDLPVNREISKGTALFWEPSHPATFFATLQALGDPEKYRSQVAAQTRAAESYSWEKTALKWVRILTHA